MMNLFRNLEMESICVGDLSIDVFRKRIRNMNLTIHPPEGRVKISVPKRMPMEKIQSLIQSKMPWILKHREKFQNMPKIQKRELQSEEIQELHENTKTLMEQWTRTMNIEIQGWRIRKMKTRWGTYSSRTRKVSINLELARHPRECLEYLIVHELTHVFVSGHGKRFQARMDKYLPDWRARRAHLSS